MRYLKTNNSNWKKLCKGELEAKQIKINIKNERVRNLEKPILFNTEMVQAILEGRKTCTRRVLKQPFEVHPNGFITKRKGNERLIPYEAPYKVGDILYVRETWMISNPFGDFARDNMTAEYMYKAGYAKGKRIPITREKEKNLGVWKPSIHMPKEAARIFLKVTGIRVERLQDITHAQILKEGTNVIKSGYDRDDYEFCWINLWEPNCTKEEYRWNNNPWVWVIDFEKIKNN